MPAAVPAPCVDQVVGDLAALGAGHREELGADWDWGIFGAVKPTGGIEVVTGPTPSARSRSSCSLLVRRTTWVVANLLLGHFVLFSAYFFSVLSFHEEDFDQSIAFGLVASAAFMGLAVAIIASLNAVLRLLNRDTSRRVFWWATAIICVVGAAANYLVHPYLL